MTVTGVEGEERDDYTRAESRSVRERSIRLLRSLLDPLRGKLVLALVVVVASTALQVAGPALIAIGIDQGLPALTAGDPKPVVFAVAAYLLAGVAGAVLISQYTMLSARISQAVLLELRKRVYLHAQRLSLEFHESYTSGRIIARQTDHLGRLVDDLLDVARITRGKISLRKVPVEIGQVVRRA